MMGRLVSDQKQFFYNFCLDDVVPPDHSVFSRARHERFREPDVFRQVFETVVDACLKEGLVGGQSLSVDARYVKADVDQLKRVPGDESIDWPDDNGASRA